MDRTLFTLSLGLAGLLLAPGVLHAAARCAPHDKVSKELAAKFGEQVSSIGLATDNSIMELYASATGTWTLTATLANGLTCLVASGQNFETVQPVQTAKGDPA